VQPLELLLAAGRGCASLGGRQLRLQSRDPRSVCAAASTAVVVVVVAVGGLGLRMKGRVEGEADKREVVARECRLAARLGGLQHRRPVGKVVIVEVGRVVRRRDLRHVRRLDRLWQTPQALGRTP